MSLPFSFAVEGLKAVSYNISTPTDDIFQALVLEPFYFDFVCLDQYGNLAAVP